MNERVKNRLKEILNGDHGAWYIGGSLDLGFCWVNTDGKVHWLDETRADKSVQLDQEGHKLVCQLYVKHKTPENAFYSECEEFLK